VVFSLGADSFGHLLVAAAASFQRALVPVASSQLQIELGGEKTKLVRGSC
jgi:hypothetical protein